MNNLTVFNNEEFGNLRTIEIDNDIWFVGKEVAEILGYSNPSKALSDHVEVKDKLNNESLSSLGQRGGWLINESGLYSLIFRSKLPSAKKFMHWVTSDVLPALRKTGSYSLSNAQDLSQNTQLVIAIGNSLAEQERRINKIETKVDGAVEGFKTAVVAIKSEANWRKDIIDKVNQLVHVKGSTWEKEWPSLYRELETRARCDLNARKRNRIRRMVENGSSKSDTNKVRKIDVIESDVRLKEIFSKIVAENMMIYCI